MTLRGRVLDNIEYYLDAIECAGLDVFSIFAVHENISPTIIMLIYEIDKS